ncbi:hypothetical protein barba126A_phanotate119 [Rheinheimera phage vB_RspM_barba_12-6A]|uniref:Uncharacterized protein n=31 Tax=Barbavirus barba18A TaxID=2734090 RepID=A0A7G9VRX9_9CAUD|nr:hypothetical protein barba13A_phanotate66 [Rheinheimera phage vB_RspM_barba_1-3A]QNO01586.1 hypothetical protein barba108A_phanotate75 [Rheinheimera phage vB_RspM_barba_10-8A]QNO01713.1 hypothetical protein barba108B_phanotate42 [Rheinheimera phage vB_RspM_barba_10-8B]QNO01907.1 hypothetical protein barba108D_phanotate76 [Rheinheimera phage vB_RspM_barba_10-8D]QNO02062.1 hypothetical protein barba109A_phanotate70 [Rheinheimera phage vB_RspM_barba_10-9A]QNO02228.1 hypothetical protein barba1
MQLKLLQSRNLTFRLGHHVVGFRLKLIRIKNISQHFGLPLLQGEIQPITRDGSGFLY